jgi:hypothetical protein
MDFAEIVWSWFFMNSVTLGRGEMIDFGDMELLGDLCTQIKWIRVVIGVRVLH